MQAEGFTALMCAAQNGHDLCALAMIEANANLDHQNLKNVTALNMACENAHEECAVLLLKAGSRSADIADAWGDTPRSIAKKKGLKKVLALMGSADGVAVAGGRWTLCSLQVQRF